MEMYLFFATKEIVELCNLAFTKDVVVVHKLSPIKLGLLRIFATSLY